MNVLVSRPGVKPLVKLCVLDRQVLEAGYQSQERPDTVFPKDEDGVLEKPVPVPDPVSHVLPAEKEKRLTLLPTGPGLPAEPLVAPSPGRDTVS